MLKQAIKTKRKNEKTNKRKQGRKNYIQRHTIPTNRFIDAWYKQITYGFRKALTFFLLNKIGVYRVTKIYL